MMLTKAQLTTIKILQEQLDQKIALKKIIEQNNYAILTSQFLALIVEVAEFANEKRCFKYWSFKKESEKSVLLEEYSDGLHFIISIANSLKLQVAEVIFIKFSYDNINLAFLSLIEHIIIFFKSKSFHDFSNMFSSYVAIGELCGFSNEDVFNAYIAKNKINHLRQKQNY